ncbi:MAG: hypothetical protein OEO20_01620 [Gemmatimonadota bacterium]|nr:hypothetical protein [Gemmatimonadota bacterium]MDH3366228.1 hypothetical protein [Gemmatimonadota bacterium]MDH3476985.1 hypothetical protein [Gemmatimonadota bacterium]MDH3570155.1 hypothetical protein [Gemmatimonadota bacterium]MDH5548727.1 hypothetical protein [Gemmatimonadota bacterium]
MRSMLIIAGFAVLGSPLIAQESTRPADWKVRFDRPAEESAIEFVTMRPGWHVTTGPAAILYLPANLARGTYRARAVVHLFPGERREGYGIFVGGQHLEDDNQTYTYFLLRKDGRFLIKRRAGTETPVLVPWTAHEGIVPHDGGEGTVKNVIEIAVGPETVGFLVNGQEVASLPRDQVDTEGVVGLRVNHALNLHITELVIEQR